MTRIEADKAWPKRAHEELEVAKELAVKNHGEGAYITQANYGPPRPWVDEYNTGSNNHCMTYTVNGRHVYQVMWEDKP